MSVKDSYMVNQHTTEKANEIKEMLEAVKALLDAGITVKSVKSVQNGTITISSDAFSATAKINSVDKTKAHIIHNGCILDGDSNTSSKYWDTTIELTSNSEVTARRGSKFSVNCTTSFSVIEYY